MLNVLIVDDDKILCECLLKLLPWREMDCNVPLTAYDGLEAWEILQNKKFDLMICDLKMPIMEGIELCGKIREERMEIDIILLSAYEDFSVARQALQYDVKDYILKPINRESIDNLEKIIRKINQNRKRIGRYFEEEYEKRILALFGSRDMEALQHVFSDLELLEGKEMINVGLYLLQILYDYLCTTNGGTDREIYKASLKQKCFEFKKLSSSRERVAYIRQQYISELEKIWEGLEGTRVLQMIMQMISENYANPDCNAGWIADKMYLSPAYIGRIFKNGKGIGLIHYITECRIRKGCQLLCETNLSVNAIAREIGYVDAGYFTRVFRSRMGISPSEYRKNNS